MHIILIFGAIKLRFIRKKSHWKERYFFQPSLTREECVGDKRARYDRCLCSNVRWNWNLFVI